MLRIVCSVLIAFTMAAFTVAPAMAQTPVSPQSLVGEWSGKWSGIWGTGARR